MWRWHTSERKTFPSLPRSLLSLVCRATFEDWGKESIICMWKPFKNPVWKVPQGHFFWYPEAKSWEMAMEGQLWWPSVERSWSGQSASARHLPGSLHVTTVCSWEPGTLLGKNLPWVVRGWAQGQAPRESPMLVCILHLHNLHFLCTPLSVGFIPNFLLITTSTIHILAE